MTENIYPIDKKNAIITPLYLKSCFKYPKSNILIFLYYFAKFFLTLMKPMGVGDPTSKGSLTLEFTLLLGLDINDILP